jgi:predicted HicB family RNase H-like nuclease
MKTVTVTLDDTIANRADAEATRQGKSLSKFVSELIEHAVRQDNGD